MLKSNQTLGVMSKDSASTVLSLAEVASSDSVKIRGIELFGTKTIRFGVQVRTSLSFLKDTLIKERGSSTRQCDSTQDIAMMQNLMWSYNCEQERIKT